MSYTAPYIDSTGIHVNTYSDIEASLVASAQSIFGTDIYLDNDSQDMQWISAVTEMLYDNEQFLVYVYNNQSPQNAVGTSLDSIVKINGLTRNSATYSTAALTLSGTAGTAISAGIATDTSGYYWDLPEDTVIGEDGTAAVTATCETIGAVTAAIGTITGISNPQYGWNAVYNAAAATPGTAVETDAALRARQTKSVALPSQTVLEGTLAAILEIDGVTRAKLYENNTASADDNGIPAHSIAAIAEGGTDTEVATEIAKYKAPGCGTYGTTAVTLDLGDNISTGAIDFSRPTDITVNVQITVIQLTGYTSTVQSSMVSAIKEYLNSLAIGTTIYSAQLYYPALSILSGTSSPSFNISSLTVSTGSGSASSSVAIAWNEVVKAGTVTVTGGV
jgi:uncharacterized phage protein gp47/JayE